MPTPNSFLQSLINLLSGWLNPARNSSSSGTRRARHLHDLSQLR